MNETLELIDSINKYPNQTELAQLVEQQNKILDEYKLTMILRKSDRGL